MILGLYGDNLPQGSLAAVATTGAIGIVLAGGVVAVLIVRIGIVVGANELHGLRFDVIGARSSQRRGCEAAQLVADGDSVAVARSVAVSIARVSVVASGSIACWSRD